MSKIWGLVLGLAAGAVLGTALVLLFSPTAGEKFRRQLRAGWQDTMEEARLAAAQKRIALEADFQRKKAGV